jgi:hypothetical protein
MNTSILQKMTNSGNYLISNARNSTSSNRKPAALTKYMRSHKIIDLPDYSGQCPCEEF